MLTAIRNPHEIVANGVMIVRTETGIAVAWAANVPPPGFTNRPVTVEIEYQQKGGKLLKREYLNPFNDLPWRDYYGHRIDHLELGIRVLDGTKVLAHLPAPSDGAMPFMRLQGEQRHITENGVSVPPALHITDERGNVFTLWGDIAPEQKSPDGEFAFEVYVNGAPTGEIASRIERHDGKTRIFTARGWRVWSTDGSFFF